MGRILDWYKSQYGYRGGNKPADDPGVQSVTRICQLLQTARLPDCGDVASCNAGGDRGPGGLRPAHHQSPLLQELAADEGALPRQLSPDSARRSASPAGAAEPDFRRQLNADAMATEKLGRSASAISSPTRSGWKS